MANARPRRRGKAYERMLLQERLILDVTERLSEVLLETGITKAELARRLDRTPGFVSQVLGGGRNLTLRTIADVAAALSHRPSFELALEVESVSDAARWEDESWGWTPPAAKADQVGRFSESCERLPAPVRATAA